VDGVHLIAPVAAAAAAAASASDRETSEQTARVRR